MGIRARLARLRGEVGAAKPASPSLPSTPRPGFPAPAPAGAAPPAPSLRDRLARLRRERVQACAVPAGPRLSAAELAEALEGELVDGGLIRVHETLPLSGRIGAVPLQWLRRAALLPGEREPLPALYLDTETTGLAGGSGTLAFLVGIARVETTGVRLTQYLITTFAAEAALLELLAQSLPADHRLVSYNGKSFDLPLLAARCRMQGVRPAFEQADHLDLLHPVRRLYGRYWPDCRLETVERRLLKLERENDLPGAEAPEAWFAWMRTGEGERLIRTVRHNRQDILSLLAAHRAVAEAVEDPVTAGADLHGLARWLQQEDEAGALDLLDRYRDRLCDDGLRLLARLLRRRGKWDAAVPIWETLAARGCPDSIERLAKYHEHVRKDPPAALRYCEMLPPNEGTAHRRTRLERKLR